MIVLEDHYCSRKVDMVPSHPASPGSIPGRISFLVEVLSSGFSYKTNVTKFRPYLSPDIPFENHNHKKAIPHLSKEGDDLSPPMQYMAVVK